VYSALYFKILTRLRIDINLWLHVISMLKCRSDDRGSKAPNQIKCPQCVCQFDFDSLLCRITQ